MNYVFISAFLLALISIDPTHSYTFFCKGNPSGVDHVGNPENCLHAVRFKGKNQFNDVGCRVASNFKKFIHGLCETEVDCQ